MKSRVRIRSISSSPSTLSRYYLKPGALAQFRNSKITAKSKAKENWNHNQISLCELKSASELALSPLSVSDMVSVPCFAVSFKSYNCRPPRCLLRKKLIAVAPIFSDS